MSVALPLQSDSILLRFACRKGFFIGDQMYFRAPIQTGPVQVGLMSAPVTHDRSLTTGETADPVSQVRPVAA